MRFSLRHASPRATSRTQRPRRSGDADAARPRSRVRPQKTGRPTYDGTPSTTMRGFPRTSSTISLKMATRRPTYGISIATEKWITSFVCSEAFTRPNAESSGFFSPLKTVIFLIFWVPAVPMNKSLPNKLIG
jgi:hypothetical protein